MVAQDYSWEKIATKLISVYDELLGIPTNKQADSHIAI
jgi:hypothetical protein